jgi:hypothetical protein
LGIFVSIIVIALLALAINVILSKLRTAWARHLDELTANAAELGLRVKAAEEKAAEEAALRLEAEQRFESCEREVNELRSRLVCLCMRTAGDNLACVAFQSLPPVSRRVWSNLLPYLTQETAELERQEDQPESASFETVSSECTSPSETCITIPPPVAADLEVCVRKERCRPPCRSRTAIIS